MLSYIHRIFVYHNYVEKYFEIDISNENHEGFRNLILTGNNGSGKSTLLRAINKELFMYKSGILPTNEYFRLKKDNTKKYAIDEISKLSYKSPKVEIKFGKDSDFLNEDILVVYIPTTRLIDFGSADRKKKLNLNQVLQNQNTKVNKLKSDNLRIAKEQSNIINLKKQIDEHLKNAKKFEEQLLDLKKRNRSIVTLNKQLQNERGQVANKNQRLKNAKIVLRELLNTNFESSPYTMISSHFLQYLIEMKEKQAFAIADEELDNIKYYNSFFKKLQNLFRNLYEDENLKLKHNFKQSQFYFEFKNGMQASFNQIADGFKSVLVVFSEIILQSEAFRIGKNIDENDLSGIVIIDEIDGHLHLSLQEKILPALTSFFPKLQFIVSTHSPQVCASDRNTYCYNISSKLLEKEYLGGVSYDVISKSHFGLPSEYSIYATELIANAKKLMKKESLTSKEIENLKSIKDELNLISPELTYELALFIENLE